MYVAIALLAALLTAWLALQMLGTFFKFLFLAAAIAVAWAAIRSVRYSA
jgi:hypothetical protein